jgi:hypothetical protein
MGTGGLPVIIAKSLKGRHFARARGGVLAGRALPALLLAAGLTAVLSGCALNLSGSEASVIKTCVLPTDQKATLAGKWKALPIPVAFHQGDFADSEISAITAAADTWNSFYSSSLGIKQVIDYGSDGSVRTSTQSVPSDACTQGLIQGTTFTGQVVIYKQAVWPHSGASTTMALTSFCTRASSPIPLMYMAYMEVNYQGFFRDGFKQPDLQTIIGHEFGHLLGLYHSCDGGSKTSGKPDCNASGLDSSYKTAVMYPTFGFNADLSGEQKRSLQSNDQGRANCLYQTTTTGGS